VSLRSVSPGTGLLKRTISTMTQTGPIRSLPLSQEEADVLVRLLNDELGREWRQDRHPQDEIVRLHEKIAAFRGDWPEGNRQR
jgi:hypothetical protein